jgi:hypothetical protein
MMNVRKKNTLRWQGIQTKAPQTYIDVLRGGEGATDSQIKLVALDLA